MVDAQTIGVLVAAVSVSVAAIYYMFTLRINMRTQELDRSFSTLFARGIPAARIPS